MDLLDGKADLRTHPFEPVDIMLLPLKSNSTFLNHQVIAPAGPRPQDIAVRNLPALCNTGYPFRLHCYEYRRLPHR